MYIETKKLIKNLLKAFDEGEKIFTDFMSPAGYTLIKAFAKNKSIDLSNFTFKKKVESFLSNLNFFDDNCKILNNKVLPIRSILNQEGLEIDEITNEFGSLFKTFLGNGKEKLISNMVNMLGELLNNIAHHSGTPDNFNKNQSFIEANYQSGQYFDKKDFIQIAIVDAGIGILASVRKKKPEIQTAKEAIKKAFEPHFTGGTVLNNNGISNAGIGLTVTLEMIKKLGGDIFIGSKDCLYSYNGKKSEEFYEQVPSWKGTFVILNIYTNKEIGIDMFDIRSKYLNNNENFDLNLNFG